MSRYLFARLALVIAILLAMGAASFAAVKPGSGKAWLVIASRDNSSAAIAYARTIAARNISANVFLSTNGWYAITLGWTNKSSGRSVKNRLVSRGIIPSDSYFHNGQRYVELIWSTSGVTGRSRSRILAATKLRASGGGSSPAPAPTTDYSANGPGYVTGLANRADSYLSFRTGPDTSNRETQRLRKNTQFSIVGRRSGWYNVQLNSGRKGWVYGRYVGLGSPPFVAKRPEPQPQPKPQVQPEPKPQPKPQIVVSDEANGTKLEVSGLAKAGFGYLSLRNGPSDTSLEVARLREKTKLVVTGKYGKWYRVKPAPSVEGWVTSAYVAAAEVPTFGPEEVEKPKKPEVIDIVVKPKADPVDKAEPVENTDNKASDGKPQRRVALIIGNSAYTHTVALPNPKNDADRISDKLKGLGFEVIVGLDGSKSQMEASIRDFVRILPGSDVAIFFYAGHAMQVNGQNHLIPIDAKLEDSTAIDFETIKLSSILSFVDQPGRISIALLDACRDNPLSRRFARSIGPTRSAFLGRGLASPNSTGNLLIGFATAPGEVALDGDGDNSPFTTALLKHIGTPKLEVEAMLKRVRADVYKATSEQQSPWVNSGLRKEFYFIR